MFLHKSLWPSSLTLPFKPFRFWLRILWDIGIRKSAPRIGESTRLPGVSIFFKPFNNSLVIVNYIPGLFFAKLALKRNGLAVKSSENQHQINFSLNSDSRITNPQSRRLPDSPYPWCRESYHGDGEFSLKKFNSWLSVSVMRGVADSAYQWFGELATLRISDAGSWRLPVSLICGVGDSPYRPDSGESFFEYKYLRNSKPKSERLER